MNKKIAIVYRNMAGISGTPNTIYAHARYLTELGYDVELVGERIDPDRLENQITVRKIRRLPVVSRQRAAWFAWWAGHLLRSGYDFIAGHGHHLWQDVLSMHNCLRLTHECIYGDAMSTPDPDTVLQDRILSRQAFSLCIANSELMRQDLIQRYAIPAEKIQVVYPGYQPKRFYALTDSGLRERYRQQLLQPLGLATSAATDSGAEPPILIGLVTSGAYRKRGVDIAIDAIGQLPLSLRRNVHLLIIGKSSKLADYQRQVLERDLQSHIHFLPVTKAIENVYHALDIYIHPARFEEFGQSAQEAMACGVPAIMSRQVGAAELLPKNAYRELPQALDAPTLCGNLQRWLTDANQRQRWREFSLQAARKNSAEVNFQRTLAVYQAAGL